MKILIILFALLAIPSFTFSQTDVAPENRVPTEKGSGSSQPSGSDENKDGKAGNSEEDPEEPEEEGSRLRPFLFAGVTAGGYADRGSFIYRDGYSATGGLLWKRNKRVYLGMHAGVEKLSAETFLPFGFTALGFRNKDDESLFFGVNAGYALVMNKDIYSLTQYSYRGGLFFQPMLGYKTEIGNTPLMLALGYKHQFAEVRYNMPDGGYYREENNYHLVSFRAGIIF